MRPSRSHESLSSPLKQHSTKNKQKLNQTPSTARQQQQNNIYKQPNKIENITKLNLNPADSSPVLISPIHGSLFNEENCFELKCLNSTLSIFNSNKHKQDNESLEEEEEDESDDLGSSDLLNDKIKYYNSNEFYSSRYFMCRTTDEMNKWLQCLRKVTQPNMINERHSENSLQVWLLEAKGSTISSKPTKKYFCEILLNQLVNARTSSKPKKDILFWGENFDFKFVIFI